MKNKLLVVTSFFLILSNLFSQTATPPALGDGSAGNPYQIATLDNLYWLSQTPTAWDKHYIQTADIDASSTSTWDGGAGFTPIGGKENPTEQGFSGNYDAQFHLVDNLYINRPTEIIIGGLFSDLYYGTIKNVGVTNVNITGQAQVGALVGGVYDGTISKCYSSGNINTYFDSGGLIGNIDGTTVISECYSECIVSGGSINNGSYSIGGLIGIMNSTPDLISINNSYFSGEVTGEFSVGGLIGSATHGIVNNCYSNGEVNWNDFAGVLLGGGLVGYIEDGMGYTASATNSFWDTETSGQLTSFGGTGKTTAEMKDLATFTATATLGLDLAWDFEGNPNDDVANEQIWDMDYCGSYNINYPFLAWEKVRVTEIPTQPPGLGTISDPYEISTLNHLRWISCNQDSWDKHYIQTADIDASSTSTWDGGAGFSPIGNLITQFTGSYDGQAHTIDGLYINRPSTAFIGLFGFSRGSEIANLGVTNVDFSGINEVGGLVGSNDGGTVSNSYSTGTVSGDFVVGGLVGVNFGTVTNSYSTGTVSGTDNVGGLVGENWGSVSNSYSTGTVSGDFTVGGLVGFNDGTVSNSYSTGAVSGSDHVGGLVGYSEGTVSNSYSTGVVNGTGNFVGGLVGASFVGTVSNSFWDVETSGQTTSDGGTGKTTAEMKTLATFTDYTDGSDGLDLPVWDFETNPHDDVANEQIWDMDLQGLLPKVSMLAKPTAFINDGYPFLAWENGDDVALPVELSEFTATATLAGVELKWRTESEIENLGFIIERRLVSGGVVNGKWDEITSYKTDSNLEGQGTTSSATDYSFTDVQVKAGTTYEYRLGDVDYNGVVTYHSTRTVTVKNTPLGIVEKFTVLPAYPNPFNPSTTIQYGITSDSKVNISIYDITGRLITTLLNSEQVQGWHSIIWNGTSKNGEQVPAGIYLSRVKFGNKVKTTKLMLLK